MWPPSPGTMPAAQSRAGFAAQQTECQVSSHYPYSGQPLPCENGEVAHAWFLLLDVGFLVTLPVLALRLRLAWEGDAHLGWFICRRPGDRRPAFSRYAIWVSILNSYAAGFHASALQATAGGRALGVRDGASGIFIRCDGSANTGGANIRPVRRPYPITPCVGQSDKKARALHTCDKKQIAGAPGAGAESVLAAPCAVAGVVAVAGASRCSVLICKC